MEPTEAAVAAASMTEERAVEADEGIDQESRARKTDTRNPKDAARANVADPAL